MIIKIVRASGKIYKRRSKIYNFHRNHGNLFTTLYQHLKSGSVSKNVGSYVSVFSLVQEEYICAYLKKMDSIFFGLTRSTFLGLVFEYATMNNIVHLFKTAKAGCDGFAGFKQHLYPNRP